MNKRKLVTATLYLTYSIIIILVLVVGYLVMLLYPSGLVHSQTSELQQEEKTNNHPERWSAPDSTAIPATAPGDLIRYGRELIAHTAVYLGPKGKVAQISNGMNCQNCHLQAGKKYFGNNYAAVAATYPKFRARSGTVESVEKRVNDCLERSLNGTKLDTASQEMRAFVAYIKWVGKDVPKGVKPNGVGILDIELLDRAADKEKGRVVYQLNCARCHGEEGKGLLAENGVEWKYPPLFGDDSYNIGAGLYRLSRLAGYVKVNMPNDLASYEKPFLSDEDAWDVAAFINSMPRPGKDLSGDWSDIAAKPFEHPFGPYADGFTEQQHKYGPFGEIKSAKER